MFLIRSLTEKDRPFVGHVLKNLWGSEQIVYSGNIFNVENLSGFLAEDEGRVVGLLTYLMHNNFLQIVSLNALVPGKGVGTTLLEKVKEVARGQGFKKIIVVTTNDNVSALGFYKKKEFTVLSVKKGAVKLSRKVKPEISLFGENGIPVEDEIELELSLTD